MKPRLLAKLETLRTNYTEITGQPFHHFYCPILYLDEQVTLCEAHVVNQAFPDASKAWTVQRKDVDNFYGAFFESDFTILSDISNHPDTDIFAKVFEDKVLHQKLKPKILLEGEEVGHLFTTGKLPDYFTGIAVEQEGQMAPIGLKMRPEAMVASAEGSWEVEISKDIRIAAVVSLIKAAHLTLFYVLGYRYTFSAAGQFVGRQILGEFYRQNRNKLRSEVLQNAEPFFREFATMVRPMVSSGIDLQGTVDDKTVFLCRGGDQAAWGVIVMVRVGTQLHGVMLPVSENVEALATYMGFLKSENETISVSICRIGQGSWELSLDRLPLEWPKTGTLYP